jgi:hypothetical protein
MTEWENNTKTGNKASGHGKCLSVTSSYRVKTQLELLLVTFKAVYQLQKWGTAVRLQNRHCLVSCVKGLFIVRLHFERNTLCVGVTQCPCESKPECRRDFLRTILWLGVTRMFILLLPRRRITVSIVALVLRFGYVTQTVCKIYIEISILIILTCSQSVLEMSRYMPVYSTGTSCSWILYRYSSI